MESIPNFLDKDAALALREVFLGSDINWFFHRHIAHIEEKEENNLRQFQFTHMLYDVNKGNVSPFSVDIMNLFKEKLNCYAMMRVKANLIPNTPEIEQHDFHTDFLGSILDNMYTGVYYVNTCDGYTEFESGEKCQSIHNKMIIFPSRLKHRGTSCTDDKARVVINFNWFK
tara:strand:+ start:346 stop:858 length:513 start_codon:yes stop_codon:yes gene_type:complete